MPLVCAHLSSSLSSILQRREGEVLLNNWSIITDAQHFPNFLPGPIACDVETAFDQHLLGVSLSDGRISVYIPITIFEGNKFTSEFQPQLYSTLHQFLSERELIGHNFTYDKHWIDKYFHMRTKWKADTRIMWHMASAPEGPRPYGLKDAQVEILGWSARGDKELEENVKEKGGSLRKGEHYLADPIVLGRYACLDTLSTFQLYTKLSSFFNRFDYWSFLDRAMQYNLLLDKNTRLGVKVDVAGLKKANDRLLARKEAAKKRFLKLLQPEVTSIEEDWADRRIAEYKREYNKLYYQTHPEVWQRFNLNSDVHKRELFYDKLRLPVLSKTKGGSPQTSADSLKQSIRASQQSDRIKEALETYLTYEKANTLTSSFTGPYLECVDSTDRLHPGFNICGTVSYRLSGFKPYLLNAPFDEKLILKNLKCDAGYVGVHADLAAIEPTITAHYSEDPSLLKVFRDGLGDIYLDLALELFPNDKELHEGYNPNVPITKAVKERFTKQRKVSKVIQLAVQYTGTGHTVSRNLTKDGIKTSVEEANGYVSAYWRKFRKVEEMNNQLKALNRQQGFLRNVTGRVIRVPHPDYKDLPNRFIQSSAHDVLMLWVTEIYKMHAEMGLVIEPVLLDCHDSTSNAVPIENVNDTKAIYQEALLRVNKALGLAVTVKMEMKTFSTLAGLKAEE